MGHMSKAIAAGGIIWSDAPDKAMQIIVYLLTLIPWWPSVPMAVQDAAIWFIAGGIAYAFAWIVWWIPNSPAPVQTPQTTSTLGLSPTP